MVRWRLRVPFVACTARPVAESWSPQGVPQQLRVRPPRSRFATPTAGTRVRIRPRPRRRALGSAAPTVQQGPSRMTGGNVSLRGIRNASGDAFGPWTLDMGTPLPVCDGITTLFEPSLTVIATYLAGLAHGVNLRRVRQGCHGRARPTSCGRSGLADRDAIADQNGRHAFRGRSHPRYAPSRWRPTAATSRVRHQVDACGPRDREPGTLMGSGALNEQTRHAGVDHLAVIGGIGAQAIGSGRPEPAGPTG